MHKMLTTCSILQLKFQCDAVCLIAYQILLIAQVVKVLVLRIKSIQQSSSSRKKSYFSIVTKLLSRTLTYELNLD